MGTHVIRVPDIGEGIAEVELVAWHVQAGDTVAEDQPLADVMTDKATVEIPSPVAGTVSRLGGAEGDTLAVGAELLRIETEGGAAAAAPAAATSAPELRASEAAPSRTQATAAPAEAPSASPATADAATRAVTAPPPAASPVASPAATQAEAPAAIPAPAATPAGPPLPAGTRVRVVASPAVRARAWELGVELSRVVPSGTGGRVMQADLDAHHVRHGGRPPAPAVAAGTPASAVVAKSPTPGAAPRVASSVPGAAGGAVHEIRIIGLRRRIAQKMQESKRRIPHYSYVEEVDVGAVEALRRTLNDEAPQDQPRLTLLPFLARAIVVAVRDWPQVNGRLDDEAGLLSLHDAVHLGIATQTEAGLMVPVIHDAQALDLWQCAAAITRLAEAARSGRIARDELSGSTITLTSLGRLGGIMSTPVINHPEVAIVGVNRIAERPVMQGGLVVGRPMMNLSSSFDHRVVDGAVAAGFIQRVRDLLEQPALLFLR